LIPASMENNHRKFSDFGVRSIFVEITNICNMHCVFCPTDHIQKNKGRMDFATFSRVIDEIASLQPVEAISLNVLGEPLMHPDVFRFLDYCRSRKVRVYLFTNGTLTPEDVVEICKRDNITALVLSYQTPDAESYRLRGCRTPFEQYREGVIGVLDHVIRTKTYEKMRVELHLANTKHLPIPGWKVLDDNAAALDVMRDLSRTIKEMYARHVVGRVDKESIEKEVEDDFKSVPENILDLREWHYWGYRVTPKVYLRIKCLGTFGAVPEALPESVTIVENCNEVKCEMLQQAICIHCDGTITNCCLDVNGEIALGNIKSHTLLQALESERRAASIENATIHALCRRCLGTITSNLPPSDQETL